MLICLKQWQAHGMRILNRSERLLTVEVGNVPTAFICLLEEEERESHGLRIPHRAHCLLDFLEFSHIHHINTVIKKPVYSFPQWLPNPCYYSKETMLRTPEEVAWRSKLPFCLPSYDDLLANNTSLLQFNFTFLLQRSKSACANLDTYKKAFLQKNIRYVPVGPLRNKIFITISKAFLW